QERDPKLNESFEVDLRINSLELPDLLEVTAIESDVGCTKEPDSEIVVRKNLN
ncbi:2201_t:CDS:1, partial [Dentiscutata erythropus]